MGMWKDRNVWIILCGEMIAGLGLWTGIIGNLEFMQEKIPSDIMKSLIMGLGLLAGILVGPLAGRIIDQSRKKTVLLLAGLGRLVSVSFMLIAIGTGSVWWMVAFMISIQLSAAFYFPALQAAIPLVVKEENLLAMNGWHMNVATVARVAGTALAGILLVYWPLSMLYWISMIAYVGLLAFTLMLRIDEHKGREAQVKTTTKSGGFMEVFPVLKSFPVVTMTLIMTLIPLLFLGSFNLMVINISEIQDSSAIKGMIYAAEGFAFMMGTIAVKYIANKWKTQTILFFFVCLIGFAEMMLVFADQQLLTLIAFAIFGFSIGCFFPTAMVIFQKQMPKEFHGRFFSFRNMLERVVFQVVLLATGALLDLIGLQWMVVVFGTVSLALTVVFFIQLKRRNIILDSPKMAAESA